MRKIRATLILLFCMICLTATIPAPKAQVVDIPKNAPTFTILDIKNKDGQSVGQFTFKKNVIEGKSSILLSLSNKGYPNSKNFRHMAEISSKIFVNLNGEGKNFKDTASVHMSNIYEPQSPTFIEINFHKSSEIDHEAIFKFIQSII